MRRHSGSSVANTESVPLPREFLRVARVVPSDQELLCVPPGTKVHDALDLMNERGFSLLPVVVGGTVIGVFTYRSLARSLQSIRRQDDPLDMPLDDLLEDLAFVRPGAELSEILHRIERDGAILVGDEDRLLAVATASDVTRFLWEATRPFILIRDIELAVRDLMRHACRSQSELQHRIAVGRATSQDENVGTMLEDLTLGDLIGVLLHGGNFGQCFRHTFGRNRDLVRSQLESARLIRNKVFHFVGDVSTEDIQSLLITWRWLERKVLMIKAQL